MYATRFHYIDDRVVQYLADTQAGSSGSPVFNADGQLIGLHHAGGRPQEVVGKLRFAKTRVSASAGSLKGWLVREFCLHEDGLDS